MFEDFERESSYNETVSELESLGVGTNNKHKLNDLNDSYEIGNLVDNIKQKHVKDYKSTSIFAD